MVILSSKTQPEAELVEALEVNGLKPVVEEKEAAEAEKPADKEEKPSGEPKTEVENTEEEGTESAAGTEPDEKKTSQEKPQGKEENPEGEKPKSRGGFQKRVDDLTRQKALVEDQLELERGSKVALQRQLDEVNAELTKLRPKEPEKAAELVRPKRPKMEDKGIEFDQTAYDAAMDEYDTKLAEYHTAIADKKADEKLAAAEERRKTETREAQVKAAENAYYAREEKDKVAYDDYAELAEALGDAETIVNRSQVVADYISVESEHPAHLVHFLMDDFVNNDGKEAARIEKLSPMRQVIAIKEIEDRLIRESKGKSKEAPEATKEAAEEKPVPEVKPPAKEKQRAETPDDPITPLGGGGARAKGKTLDEQMREASEAGDSRAFRKLFDQQQAEKQAARV